MSVVTDHRGNEHHLEEPSRVTVLWAEAVEVACPECHAGAGQVCRDEGVPRKACHGARHLHAIELGVRPKYRDGHKIRYEDPEPSE